MEEKPSHMLVPKFVSVPTSAVFTFHCRLRDCWILHRGGDCDVQGHRAAELPFLGRKISAGRCEAPTKEETFYRVSQLID